MLNLPIQSAPTIRSRVTRGSVAAASSGVSPSVYTFNPILMGPFASGYTVGPSLIGIMGIPILPFAREAADG